MKFSDVGREYMKLARWFINGRFLSQPPTGVQRYAEEIVRALDELLAGQNDVDERLAVELLCPPASRDFPGLKSIACRRVGCGKGHIWEQVVLPQYVAGWLLSLGNTGPLAVSRQIICMHDANTLLFPQSYSRKFRIFYRGLLPRLGRRVASIVTVSNYSSFQLEHFGITDASKIKVIPNGYEHTERWQPKHSEVTRKASGPDTIVLIGSAAPHKNIALMLRLAPSLKRNGLKLAIAGALDPKVFHTGGLACQTPCGDGINWLGRVSDSELAALLKDCLCLALPSYEEGFGLPALEAMALGCPVVASDRASIPEVCGAAALYAAPGDDRAWLENILRLRRDLGLRRELTQQGQERAKRFSWRQSALCYLNLMTALDNC